MLEGLLKVLWIFATLGLLLTTGLGLWSQDPSLHLSTGILLSLVHFFAALFILFYFVGTGVWLRDRARECYRFNKDNGQIIWVLYQSANKLKAVSMPILTFSIVLGIFTFILGAGYQVGAAPAWIHPTLGILWLVLSVVGTYPLFKSMGKNLSFLDEASKIIDSTSN